MKEIKCRDMKSRNYGRWVEAEDCLNCEEWSDCPQRHVFGFRDYTYTETEKILLVIIGCAFAFLLLILLMVLL
jgi:hypothetical protein